MQGQGSLIAVVMAVCKRFFPLLQLWNSHLMPSMYRKQPRRYQSFFQKCATSDRIPCLEDSITWFAGLPKGVLDHRWDGCHTIDVNEENWADQGSVRQANVFCCKNNGGSSLRLFPPFVEEWLQAVSKRLTGCSLKRLGRRCDLCIRAMISKKLVSIRFWENQAYV